MSHTAAKERLTQCQIRSDGLFYLILSVIGGTYVVLILLMLAADVVYLTKSDNRSEMVIDFTADGFRKRFANRDDPGDRFREYGLEFLSPGNGRTLEIFNSSQPGDHPEFGSPHNDYGGPGTGSGGRRGMPASNDRPLGNILVLSNDQGPTSGTIQLRWQQPVELERVVLFNTTLEGRLSASNPQSDKTIDRPLPATGASGVMVVPLRGANANELTIDLPGGGAIAEIAYFWAGRIRADWELDHPLLSRIVNNPITAALSKPEIQYSISLSLISCTITAILSLWVAVPIGYLLSRHHFFGRDFIDAVLDIPIVLPPLVVGLSLLILFQFTPSGLRELVVYQIPAVILAQFAVACAFAVRTMRATFDQIDPRCEQVALTLGCSRFSAFGRVVLPEAMRGMLTAGTLAWARALGEFGPLLIFAGATRNKTEVLSTTVFLELSVGDLSAAVAVSIVMVVAAVTVLILARVWGTRTLSI